MPEPLSFYFDFSSPYSWIAAERINGLAARHAREVRWRAIMLGPLLKESGNRPLLDQPLKGDYTRLDFARSLRLYGLKGGLPSKFPVATVGAARIFHWLRKTAGRDVGQAYALAVFRAYFSDGRDISDRAVAADIAGEEGQDREAALVASNDPVWKAKLVAEGNAAREAGVFGAPYILADGEPFWGSDRLDMLDDWLSRGGW
ncbi:2-hydroxychromene-2-carboxylate isomerase [Rhodospirillum sp. A1_3_36]|uniref:2-hydroxychromene-2-carboxylate isomerase n=1 Tax=Rhodospirillum sp. A1_3_36 TaxID=3391666 RepID=UPI0039A5BF79